MLQVTQIFGRPGKCEEENLASYASSSQRTLQSSQDGQECSEALTAVAYIAKDWFLHCTRFNHISHFNTHVVGEALEQQFEHQHSNTGTTTRSCRVSILWDRPTKENHPLQAKAIECLGLIRVCGTATFGADATAATNWSCLFRPVNFPLMIPEHHIGTLRPLGFERSLISSNITKFNSLSRRTQVRICKCVGDHLWFAYSVLPPPWNVSTRRRSEYVTDEEDDSNTNAADKDAAAAGMSTRVIEFVVWVTKIPWTQQYWWHAHVHHYTS